MKIYTYRRVDYLNESFDTIRFRYCDGGELREIDRCYEKTRYFPVYTRLSNLLCDDKGIHCCNNLKNMLSSDNNVKSYRFVDPDLPNNDVTLELDIYSADTYDIAYFDIDPFRFCPFCGEKVELVDHGEIRDEGYQLRTEVKEDQLSPTIKMVTINKEYFEDWKKEEVQQ